MNMHLRTTLDTSRCPGSREVQGQNCFTFFVGPVDRSYMIHDGMLDARNCALSLREPELCWQRVSGSRAGFQRKLRPSSGPRRTK